MWIDKSVIYGPLYQIEGWTVSNLNTSRHLLLKPILKTPFKHDPRFLAVAFDYDYIHVDKIARMT